MHSFCRYLASALCRSDAEEELSCFPHKSNIDCLVFNSLSSASVQLQEPTQLFCLTVLGDKKNINQTIFDINI